MLTLPGAIALRDWFDGVTSFHDDDVVACVFDDSGATLTISASRMTSEVDDNGFFVSDKHAVISIRLTGLTGIKIEATFPNQLLELAFRRVGENATLPRNSLVEIGDIEMSFDDVYGGGGSIFAKQVTMKFEPRR